MWLWPILGLYGLVFGEFFLRVMKPTPLLPRYVTAAPYGVRMNVPGASYWQTTEEIRVQIRINLQGIRSDREIAPTKPAGVCRVVLYGDSFFMGYEVEIEDSFAFLLERSLREAGRPCEVVNLAVSGFGTAEMLVALRADGLRYEPDLVVFQWHATDPADNVRSGLFALRDGELVRSAQQYLPAVAARDALSRYAVYRWAIENSHLYASLREAAAARVKALLLWLRASAARRSDPRREATPVLDARLLQAAQEEAREHGAAFLVVEIPVRQSRTQFVSAPPALPNAVLEGIPWVSPLEAFRAAAHAERILYREKGHGHLSELGNRLLSEVVVEAIEKKALLGQAALEPSR